MIAKENYLKSLKDISCDTTNGVSLIKNDEIKMLCLDDMISDISKDLCINAPSSCDAVYMKNDKIYVIEFKNRKYSQITSKDKRDIREKAYHSMLFLLHLEDNKSMVEIKDNATLFVVFKEMDEEASYKNLVETINRYANGNDHVIRCQLGKLKGKYYKEIYTIDKEVFESVYLSQL